MNLYDSDGEDMSGYVMGLDERINKLENRVDVYRAECYRMQLETVELQRKIREQHDEILRLQNELDSRQNKRR